MFNQLFLNGIIAGSVYALIALGFAVIYKTVRFFHFAHGVVYTAERRNEEKGDGSIICRNPMLIGSEIKTIWS